MKKHKIPRELLLNAQKVGKDLTHYEAIERYVLKYILEAERSNVAMDDVFIRAAYKALQNKPLCHHSAHAAQVSIIFSVQM